MASRESPLTIREGQKLGMDDVVRLAFVREMRLEEKNRLSHISMTEGKERRKKVEKLLENATIDLIQEVFDLKTSRGDDSVKVHK